MTLNEYQIEAAKTDIRDESIKMICNGFGLLGELEELKTCYTQQELKEAGDVLWYCASICSCFNVGLQDVYDSVDFVDSQLDFVDSQQERPLGEIFKKVYRDDNGTFTLKIQKEILTLIGNTIVNYLENFGDLEEIMKLNIEKLQNRKHRGAIQGDGDNR